MPLILDNEPKTQFEEVAQFFIASFPRPSFEPDYAAKAAAANGIGQSIVTTTTTATGATTTALVDAEQNILAAMGVINLSNSRGLSRCR